MPALDSPSSGSDRRPERHPDGGARPVRIPLTQLKKGERAIVQHTGLSEHDARLLDAMGLSDQSEVRVCRAGTPCIVQIEATRLGISADMAAKIVATPCSCYPEPETIEPPEHRNGSSERNKP
jgi:Fe2+ transport system protein FeoA